MSINYKELADKYGTPFYAYDFSHITTQYNTLKDAFKARKSLIAYAVKANSNLSVIKHLAALGAGADCVSIGGSNSMGLDRSSVARVIKSNKRVSTT